MDCRISRTEKGVVQYPMHTHRRYEIMLYLDGQGHMCTEQGNVPFSRGSVIIVPPGVQHGSRSERGFCNISVEGDFDRYLHTAAVVALSDNEAGEGRALAELIYRNRYGSPQYLSALCTAYITLLTERLGAEQRPSDRLEQIIAELSERALDAETDPTAILTKSGYSEDYIRALFKQATGKTPHGLLTDIRIRHACFLIDVYKNELTLAEIAEKCGYLDYVYFSKKFKSVTGVSPRAYRGQ